MLSSEFIKGVQGQVNLTKKNQLQIAEQPETKDTSLSNRSQHFRFVARSGTGSINSQHFNMLLLEFSYVLIILVIVHTSLQSRFTMDVHPGVSIFRTISLEPNTVASPSASNVTEPRPGRPHSPRRKIARTELASPLPPPQPLVSRPVHGDSSGRYARRKRRCSVTPLPPPFSFSDRLHPVRRGLWGFARVGQETDGEGPSTLTEALRACRKRTRVAWGDGDLRPDEVLAWLGMAGNEVVAVEHQLVSERARGRGKSRGEGRGRALRQRARRR
jgi:hypothetical protein